MLVKSLHKNVAIGEIITVHITEAEDYDLYAVLEPK